MLHGGFHVTSSPEECIGERCELLHTVNLMDIDIDLGDVMPAADVISHLEGIGQDE